MIAGILNSKITGIMSLSDTKIGSFIKYLQERVKQDVQWAGYPLPKLCY